MNQNKKEASIFYKKSRWSYSNDFVKKTNWFMKICLPFKNKNKILKACDKNHALV